MLLDVSKMTVFNTIRADCIKSRQVIINDVNVSASISKNNDEIRSLQEILEQQQKQMDEMNKLLHWSADSIEKLSHT